MINILITGGAGFIGSCLAEKLLENPENYIVIIDDLSTGDMAKLPKTNTDRWHFIKCDVNKYRDISEVFFRYNFDYVFHYAAYVGVLRTQQNPVRVLEDLHGIEYVLNLCKNCGVKRVFFSSSSEVYGEPVELPQNELTTPLNSRVPYAIVKNAGEAFLRSYQKEFDLDYTIFRFFNTYGPKQSRDFVISKFISQALKNQNITIYGDGSQTRTFCFVDDNIEACVNSFYDNLLINDVANIGGGTEITMLNLAEMIIDLTNSKSKINYLPPLPEGDMSRRLPEVTKMNALLRKTPVSLEVGIKKILENTSHILR